VLLTTSEGDLRRSACADTACNHIGAEPADFSIMHPLGREIEVVTNLRGALRAFCAEHFH